MSTSYPWGKFELDADPNRVDREVVWAFLANEAYWDRSRTRGTVEQQLDNSWRVVGAYDRSSGEMVGFARAVSDGGSTAYLADVFVVRSARGNGLGKELVRAMIEHGPGAQWRWMLHTKDAHGLYSQFGFRPAMDNFLERPKASDDSRPSEA